MKRKLVKSSPVLMVLVLISALCLIFAGCAGGKSESADSSKAASSKSVPSDIAVSSASLAPSSEAPAQSVSVKIGEMQAVKLALAEAKLHQDEYQYEINEADTNNAKTELKSEGGKAYYAIVFEQLACTHDFVSSYPPCHTAVGVDVDADSGEILAVHRFK